MGIVLCEQNFRDVWRRNKSVRAEIGKNLRTHTHAAKLVVRILHTGTLKHEAVPDHALYDVILPMSIYQIL